MFTLSTSTSASTSTSTSTSTPASTSTPSLSNGDRGPNLLGIAISLCTLSCLVLLGRLYARLHLLKTLLTWDDWCIFFAVLLIILITILTAFEVRGGTGKHIWAIPDPTKPPGKYEGGIVLAFTLSIGLSKASVLLQLLRLTLASSYWLRATFALCIGTTAATMIATVSLRCVSVTAKAFINDCLQRFQTMQTVAAAVNTATDLLVWVAPTRLIWRIQLPECQKVMLVTLFTLSSLTWISSMVRLKYVVAFGTGKGGAKDSTYDIVPLAIATVVEVNSGVVFASVLSLGPIVKRWWWWPHRGADGQGLGGRHRRQIRQSEVILETYQSKAMTAGEERAEVGGSRAIDWEIRERVGC